MKTKKKSLLIIIALFALLTASCGTWAFVEYPNYPYGGPYGDYEFYNYVYYPNMHYHYRVPEHHEYIKPTYHFKSRNR